MTRAGPPLQVGTDIVIGPPLPVGGSSAGPGVIVVPGDGGSGDQHEHIQTDASTTWVVDHNLGRRPTAWSLFDEQGRLRDEYLVELPTVNRAVVRMDVPATGTIRMI